MNVKHKTEKAKPRLQLLPFLHYYLMFRVDVPAVQMYYEQYECLYRPKTTTALAITILLSSVATWLWAATLLSLLGMSWNGSLPSSSLLWCIHLLLLPPVPMEAAVIHVAIMAHIIAVTLAPIGVIEVETNRCETSAYQELWGSFTQMQCDRTS